MLINEIKKKVIKVLISVLNLKDDSFSKDLVKSKIEEWDSLKHITIIAELETEFDIQFEPEEIVELNSYEKIIDLIIKKL